MARVRAGHFVALHASCSASSFWFNRESANKGPVLVGVLAGHGQPGVEESFHRGVGPEILRHKLLPQNPVALLATPLCRMACKGVRRA
jgi:hypothetical protein